jgi:4-hydroxy-tetrahydrodipicolinate synthase
MRPAVDDLEHPMLWLTSGVGEFRALMIDAGKRLLELAIAD